MKEEISIPLPNCHTVADKHSPYWSAVGSCPGLRVEKGRYWDRGRKFLLCPSQVNLPGATGERIVFLSDLHWNGLRAGEYEELAELINVLEVDWLIFGGDLTTFMDNVEKACAWLGTLHARYGKLAVPGNRESVVPWLDYGFWKRVYGRAGFQFLVNESWDCGHGPVFYGVDDARYGKPDWSGLARWKGVGRPVVILSHNPDAPADVPLEAYLGDLVLCGHTHGGQLVLPLYGPLYTSSAYGRQFCRGWNRREDGTLLLTSTGIGESGFGFIRRRIFCPREVALLHLLAAPLAR